MSGNVAGQHEWCMLLVGEHLLVLVDVTFHFH